MEDPCSVEYPCAILESVQFGLLSPQDIMRISVFDRKCGTSVGITDSRLGLPNTEDECKTCGETEIHKCEGHFGHMILPTAVYHPNYVSAIKTIFNSLCLSCLSIKRSKPQCDPLENQEIEINPLLCLPWKGANTSGDVTLYENGLALKKTSTAPNKGLRSLKTYMRRSDCKRACRFCKEASYPNLKVSVVRETKLIGKSKKNGDSVEKLLLEFKSNKTYEYLPLDYLKHLKKRPEDFDDEEQYLLPIEAMEVLSKLSDEVVGQLKMNAENSRPASLVMQSILVPPNCCRIPEKSKLESWKLRPDGITNKLKRLLRLDANNMAEKVPAEEVQLHISHYFRSKGAPKVRGNREPATDYVLTRSKRQKSEVRNIGEHIGAKITTFSGRAVLTGDTFLSLDEIGIPLELGKELTVPEIVSNSNIKKVQEDYGKGHGPKAQCELRYLRGGSTRDLTVCDDYTYTPEIGDVIQRPIRDGDYVFINRPPSIHKCRILGLRARLMDTSTFAINPLICSPLGADFDGDCLALFVPQSMEAIAEVKELMMIQKQLLSSHGDKCTFRFTEDSLLAAYKLTHQSVLIKKHTMEDGCFISSSSLPIPSIVKSPKGSYWTGSQLFQLSLPAGVNYREHGVNISESELLVTGDDADWLGIGSCSLLKHIIQNHGNEQGVLYLKSLQNITLRWISYTGFSIGSDDFFNVCLNSCKRSMKDEIIMTLENCETNLTKKTDELVSRSSAPYQGVTEHLQSLSVIGLEKLKMENSKVMLPSKIEEVTLKHVNGVNHIFEMVKAGAKGNTRKFVEQIACLGLQSGVLIKNSFADGLNPKEFYTLSQCRIEKDITQALEASDTGMLFKHLLLHGRDLQIHYDGTVRSRHGNLIVQFKYGMNGKTKEDTLDSPGEPVGITAATAVLQPAYQETLESSKDNRGSGSLKLLQDTLYSNCIKDRGSSKSRTLKKSDRRIVLFFKCLDHLSKEKVAIVVQKLLKHVTLDMVLTCISIFYSSGMENNGHQGLVTTEGYPWVVHLSLSELSLMTWSLSLNEVLEKLKGSSQFKDLAFDLSEYCPSCSGSSCIIFSIRDSKRHYSAYESLSLIRYEIVPRLRESSIMGDSRIESSTIIPSDEICDSWMYSLQSCTQENFGAEVAIEVYVEKSSLKAGNDAWLLIQELCSPVVHLIDWSRTIPGSIPGMVSIYGIEATCNFIYQRIRAVMKVLDPKMYKQHMLLIADMMTHAGIAVGLNAVGFKDLSEELNLSAPLTSGFFKNPIQHIIQKAAYGGTSDKLSAALSAACFGKPAPVGTGANFDLVWRV